jgi:hypothetical protein
MESPISWLFKTNDIDFAFARKLRCGGGGGGGRGFEYFRQFI